MDKYMQFLSKQIFFSTKILQKLLDKKSTRVIKA